MSEDLISRQAAIDAFEKRTHIDWESLKILHPMFEVLEDLPSAERRGRWKCVSIGRYGCSLCGHEPYYVKDLHYCPNCGAFMRGEEE